MGKACNSHTEHRIFVGETKGRRPLGRPRCKWKDNIEMDVRDIKWDDIDWFDLAQIRKQWRTYVSTVVNPRDLENVGKFMSS
jgi:hypothetical protein